MKLSECLTLDLEERGRLPEPSRRALVKKMLLDPGARAVAYYRVAVSLREAQRLGRGKRLAARLILMRISRVPGLEVRTNHEIGAGLMAFHPHDIVIGEGARIGRCVTLYNGVTLGARALVKHDEVAEIGSRYPTLDDGVIVYSGAKLIGPITIGADSIVGANSVVTHSFPAGSVIAGAPARLVNQTRSRSSDSPENRPGGDHLGNRGLLGGLQ